MSADTILQYNAVHNEYDKLQFQLAIQCAPVIKGIKASNLYTLERKNLPMLSVILKTVSLDYIYIGKDNKILVFIYHKKRLKNYLKQVDVLRFLQVYGYEHKDFEQLLLRLVIRIKEFQNKGNEFPHELGVFLEYPVSDVEGFIKNNGKNFLYTGYWKVYSNVEKAKSKFQAYDKAREDLMKSIIEGKRLNEIIGQYSWNRTIDYYRKITSYSFHK